MDEYLNEWNVLVFSSVEKSYQYQYAWGLGPSLRSGTNTSTGTTVPVVVVAVGPPSATGSRGRLGCRQQVLRQVAHDWGRALVLGSRYHERLESASLWLPANSKY
jgi:hypothetical protein